MNGMYTVGDIARMSVTDHLVQAIVSKPRKGESNIQTVENGEELLYRLFGVNAEPVSYTHLFTDISSHFYFPFNCSLI